MSAATSVVVALFALVASKAAPTPMLAPPTPAQESATAAALRQAIELRSALEIGLNHQDYLKRLVDLRIAVDRASPGGLTLGPDLGKLLALKTAVIEYQQATTVWDWKIQHVEERSERYTNGYDYSSDNALVTDWLNNCPRAKQDDPGFLHSGSWDPDVVMQCFWSDAAKKIQTAEAWK